MTKDISKKFRIYNKGLSVIDSCETMGQLNVAWNWAERAMPVLGRDKFGELMNTKLFLRLWIKRAELCHEKA